MTISPNHRLITVQADALLERARDDSKRDLLVSLHAIGKPDDIIMVAASSESKIRVIRAGRMFSLEIPPTELIAGDMVSTDAEGAMVRMVVVATSRLLNPV